jgi:hypothetical protein
VVGKRHLGLGAGFINGNGAIKPGPLELGFDSAFILPATGDRVPCVYVEDRKVVGLDPADPIRVSFQGKVGDEPSGRENPELLKMKLSKGHDSTMPPPTPIARWRWPGRSGSSGSGNGRGRSFPPTERGQNAGRRGEDCRRDVRGAGERVHLGGRTLDSAHPLPGSLHLSLRSGFGMEPAPGRRSGSSRRGLHHHRITGISGSPYVR